MTVLKLLYTSLAVGTAGSIVTNTRYVNLCFFSPGHQDSSPTHMAAAGLSDSDFNAGLS